MTIRRDLDGLRVQLPGAPEIYLMIDGLKHWIPNPPTYNNLFRDWNNIVQDANINTIDTGPQISDGAVLAQANGHAEVYLIDQGHKRWITSPGTMDRYTFSWSSINHVAPILIASIPSGANITWPE